MVELAADTLAAIGLTHGVVHLELFYHPELGAQVLTPLAAFHRMWGWSTLFFWLK